MAQLKAAILIFIIIFQYFAEDIHAQKAANQFRRLDSGKGLSNNHVNTVFTDSNGFLWAGTVSGLNRFDGYCFKVYKVDPSQPGSIPFNSVNYIYEDHLGWLWIFDNTGQYTIFNPDNELFVSDHPLFDKYPSISGENISFLKTDSNSRLWIGTADNGLFVFDARQNELHHYTNDVTNPGSLSHHQINSISFGKDGKVFAVSVQGTIDVIDPEQKKIISRLTVPRISGVNPRLREYHIFTDCDDNLWIYSMEPDEGVHFYNYTHGKWSYLSTSSSPLSISSQVTSGVIQDNSGRIWISSDHGGINIIDMKNLSVKTFVNIPGDPTSLSANSITSMHKGVEGIIWLSTFKNGINYYHENLFVFDHYRSGPLQENEFFANDVNCFAEDSTGNLWIGTNGGGLAYFERAGNTFKHWRHNPANPRSLSSDVIVSLHMDRQNRLWIGTYQGGLNMMQNGQITHFRHDPSKPGSISDDRIWQIIEDRQGNIWIGTLGAGLDLYNPSSNTFINYSPANSELSSGFVMSLFEASDGNIWIGTSFGLNVLDQQTNKIRTFMHDENQPGSLSHNHVLSLREDNSQRLWIGTRNGLNLFDPQSGTFKKFSTGQGLPDHNIISIEPADDGSLWLATLNGLSQMVWDEVTGKASFRNFDLSDGLQGREFNEHSSLRTRAGELIFGGANGFNLFNPLLIAQPEQNTKVIITEFSLFNKPVKVNEVIHGKVLISQSLTRQPRITLRHNQNVFTFGFSALNFFQPEKIRFRYMLEGFNDQWLETDATSRVATYTNLNPGTYTFRIKAQSTNGNWDSEETTLQIVVIPPFYATLWAYIFYYTMFVALLILLIFMIKRRERLKFLRKQEKEEYARIRELDAMKTRFFTNVSHEFRTPLTMIITPVEKLLKETGDNNLRTHLEMIHRNGKRLLSLVNQLLDFRKLEKNKISLNLAHDDVVRAVREYFISFTDLFESKNIQYRFITNVDEYLVNFDADKLEKIVFNLVSNAVKFTPENGIIELEVHRCDPVIRPAGDIFDGKEYTEIIVRDTGLGIAPERHEKIFERFFQSTENTSVINQGSGIGLALTLEFVRMHGGTIQVKSAQGEGSCFTVRMPLVSSAPQATTLIKSEVISTKPGQVTNYETTADDSKKPSVLIVEDNEDLRFYLRENLKKRFTILEASNGAKGWEIVQQQTPWLVVSDIMMPVEDGISLCRKIKGDAATSHIPVILLTARGSDEQRLEGLQAGAEDYITKPFNYEVLELKITRLMELRRSFQQTFAKRFAIEPGEVNITSLDEKFLTRALELVNQHIDDTRFSVEKMGRELGMSRGHLYNKLVSLTGKTPLEFIRIMRLKRAAQLLGKSQLTVAEIAYQAGFNDPKYFARYFREEYGMNPSEYARKKGQTISGE